MNRILGFIGRIGFFVLSVLLIGWTGAHTYDVLFKTNPIQGNEILAFYGLLVFEAGAVIWLAIFMKSARGIYQQAFSLIGLICGFALVLVAFFADMMIPANDMTAYGGLARWLVVIATGINLVLAVAYEIADPDVWEQLNNSFHVSDVMERANVKARQKIEEQSDAVAEQIAEKRKQEAFRIALIAGGVQQDDKKQDAPSKPEDKSGDLLDGLRKLFGNQKPQETLTMAASVEPIAPSGNGNGARPNAPTPSATK